MPTPTPSAPLTFLSPAAQPSLDTSVATPPPTAVPTVTGTVAPPVSVATSATPGLTQGGGDHFQVVVMNAVPGGEGLMLNRGISDQTIPAASGQTTFSVPADAFAHTAPTAVIELSAQQANGQPLPNWVSFDAAHGKFVVTPPKGVNGELTIKVIARDAQGHEVVSTFKVHVGAKRPGQASLEHAGRPGLSAQVAAAAQARQAGPLERLARLARAAGRAST
jgi:hypothetical protein